MYSQIWMRLRTKFRHSKVFILKILTSWLKKLGCAWYFQPAYPIFRSQRKNTLLVFELLLHGHFNPKDCVLFFFSKTEGKYIVTTYTGNTKEAGTNANVYIKFTGVNGDSREIQLSKSETPFQQGG